MLETLRKQVGIYKTAAVMTPFFTAGEVLMDVMIPYVTASLIDKGIEAGNMANVWKYGGIMLMLAFVALFCGFMSGRNAAYASTGFAANLRRSMYDKIQTFSFANIDKFSTAGLITRMTTDVTNIQNAFQMIIRMAVRPPMMLIMSVVMCLTISPSLSSIFAVAVAVLAVGLALIMVNVTKIFRKTFEKYDELNASVQENVSAARVVKAFVREDYETQKFSAAARNLKKMFVSAEAIIALNNPIMMTVVYGCIIALSWFGAKQVVGGVLTTGELTSMFSYIMNIMMSLMMLSMVFVMITMSGASAQRISEVLNEEPDITNTQNPVMEVKDGQIDFDDVYFSYKSEGSGDAVLEDIDLHIHSGETIGIIGGTGSGKSTLVSLISRLYDVTSGAVRVGGVDVREYDQEVLRNNVAVVLQKNVLFSGTILENLRWGKTDATEEECIAACRMACADEFIEKFPDGYNSRVEQGGNNLSGGQKQRLCIARALLKSPKVLILDDSTSAVDTATDAKIRTAFAEYIPEVTKLIIAQRISSVEHADRIVVLNEGRVDGFDTHENLLQNNAIYQEIYETQMHGNADFDEPQRMGGQSR